MKVKVTIVRRDLDSQIIAQSRGDDDPRDNLLIEGEEIRGVLPPRLTRTEWAIDKKYPKIRETFTPVEYLILREMYEQQGVVVNRLHLYYKEGNLSNVVDVHIKNIRRKLVEGSEYPFIVRTHNACGVLREDGGYSLTAPGEEALSA